MMAAVASISLAPAVATAATPPPTAQCEALEETLITIDLLAAEVFPTPFFKNWGQVVSSAMTDPVFFTLLQVLVSEFSSGEIIFSDPMDAMSTIAKCRLMPLEVQLINN
jgi:hypothetical protein